MASDERKTDWLKPLALSIVGALGGAVLGYVSSIEKGRLDLLRTSRRDAYVDFLDAEVLWNLNLDSAQYAKLTAAARKRIAIYGNQDVAEALATFLREDPRVEKAVCGGEKEFIRNDVAIYQRMREDIMPWGEGISDADMMLLVNFCRLPREET